MRRPASSTDLDLDGLIDGWADAGLVERTGWDGAPFLATPLPTPGTGKPGHVAGAWFDASAVERVLRFFGLLRQQVGRWRGQSFVLTDWQVRHLVAPVFGWKHSDVTRVIRTVWFEIPRKNGKSTLCSGLSLYLWCADREPGAQVFAAAGDRLQARIVFDAARAMAESAPPIRKRSRLLKSVLEYPATGSLYRALSSDGGRQHGLNIHGAVIDEVHVHRKRDLVDALETGTGSRTQPLVVFITTADDGADGSIYAEKREYLEQVAAGHVADPSFYGVVFAADPAADPHDPAVWRAANPGIGWTVSHDYLAKESRRAHVTPGYLNEFLRLHLNIRTKQTTRWLDLTAWDACGGILDLDQLAGRPCYGGLDLSATSDLTALVLLFPPDDLDTGVFEAVPFFWLPEDTLDQVARRVRVPVRRWARTVGPWGPLLRLTEGNVVDYRAIREFITQDLAQRFQVRAVGYDPWHATETALELVDAGLHLEPVRQGYASLSPPSKELERLLLGRRVNHGGHPILRWNADCVEIKSDDAGNIKPVKPDRLRSSRRIDGISALVNAAAMHLVRAGAPDEPGEPRIRVLGG